MFALRLLALTPAFVGSLERDYLRLWFITFLLVCLQMTTALHSFVGRSDTLLSTKKLFFLSHRGDSLGSEQPPSPPEQR